MDIVFSSNKSVISWLIRYFTESNVSHVSIRFGNGESNWMVDSTGYKGGVRPGWWNYFKKRNKIVECYEIINIEEGKLERIVDVALDKLVGRKYDYLAIFGLFIAILIKKIFRKEIKNFLGSSKLDFCSEFVLEISNTIKKETEIEIYKGKFEEVTPRDLRDQSRDNEYLAKKEKC